MTNVHRILRYKLHHGPGEPQQDSHYIDLARDISAMNMRLYQQGRLYTIKSITLANNVDSTVAICAAPNTWVTHAAWKRGFRLWNKMNRDAMEGSGFKKSRWHDFKVLLKQDMISDPDIGRPIDSGDGSGSSLLQLGDWVYSKFANQGASSGAAADSFNAHLMGEHDYEGGSTEPGLSTRYSSCALIRSYGESRTQLRADGVDTDGQFDPLANLFNMGGVHDNILDYLDDDNDAPPYPAHGQGQNIGELYPGAVNNMNKPWVLGKMSVAPQSGESGVDTLQNVYWDIPCGLLEIETNSTADDTNVELIIELAPGSYNGLRAPRMG